MSALVWNECPKIAGVSIFIRRFGTESLPAFASRRTDSELSFPAEGKAQGKCPYRKVSEAKTLSSICSSEGKLR